MAPTATELSVVIPVFNESSAVETVLREWTAHLIECGISYEFVVVNDGSMDGTGRVLDRLRNELPNIRVIHQLNMGQSRAIRRGLESARGHFILQLDANGAVETSEFPRFWENRLTANLLQGQRTHRLDGLSRRLFSSYLKSLTRLFFGTELQDPDGTFRLMDRDAAMAILPSLPKHWEFGNLALAIMLSMAFSGNVQEIKIPHRKRAFGKVKTSVVDLFFHAMQAISELWQLRRMVKNAKPQSVQAIRNTAPAHA